MALRKCLGLMTYKSSMLMLASTQHYVNEVLCSLASELGPPCMLVECPYLVPVTSLRVFRGGLPPRFYVPELVRT